MGGFSKIFLGLTLGMTSEGLGEMFEGDFADICVETFPLKCCTNSKTYDYKDTGHMSPSETHIQTLFRISNWLETNVMGNILKI